MAWPVIGENFLQTMLGIVDTLLVAQLGAIAIAGVGSALQVMFFVIAAKRHIGWKLGAGCSSRRCRQV
jgi:MATE family multidrug resistance protein